MARLDPAIADVAKRFVLVRLTNMRGLDLRRFDVDYDLNWHGLFFSAAGEVLGRFGGRDADTPGKNHSLKGLRHAMERALLRHEQERDAEPLPPGPSRRAEEYPAARRLSATSCIHCHHVREFQRDERRQAGTWNPVDEYVYPEPAALGLTLDTDQGDRIIDVKRNSAAQRAGLRPGDLLRKLGGRPIASIMDVQHALHYAPAQGQLAVSWQRGDTPHQGQLELHQGWRHGDISWRWSLKALPPGPQVQGDDLSAAERTQLGLDETQLALRQNGFLSRPAEQAGFRPGDVIVGVNGQNLRLTARQFEAHIRLNFQEGQTVYYDILRGGQRLTLPLRLQ